MLSILAQRQGLFSVSCSGTEQAHWNLWGCMAGWLTRTAKAPFHTTECHALWLIFAGGWAGYWSVDVSCITCPSSVLSLCLSPFRCCIYYRMVVGVVTVTTFYFVSIIRLFLSQSEFYRDFSFFFWFFTVARLSSCVVQTCQLGLHRDMCVHTNIRI